VKNGTNLTSTAIYNDRLQPCWFYATTGSALATNTACTAADPGPGNILDLQYTYNLGSGDNGNVIGIANKRDTTRSQSFAYDQVNRITSGQTSTNTGSNCWGEAYSYDQWANLQSLAYVTGYSNCPQGEGTWSFTPTGNNQVPTYTYDAAGNVLNDNFNIYQWNAESEIKNAAGVNYTYDGDGDRIEKSNGKLYWYGAGTEILDESDLSGNFTNEYVFFGGKRIAMRSVSSGTIYYYAEDMLGSSRTMVQAGATSVCFDADFYPFGGERDVTTSCSPTYKFEGKERDSETNNDDFGARYYSWRVGRWLSADWSAVPTPVPYANLTNPQTLNLYAMVSDSPETFADLDGHELVPLGVHTDNQIKERKKEIGQELKNNDLTKEQKDALKEERNTLSLEQQGNHVVGNLLADLDKTGQRNGLQLSNFTLTTDTKNDFAGHTTPEGMQKLLEAQAFVIQGNGQFSGAIYLRTEPASGFYQMSQTNSDFGYYGASALSHEQVHLNGGGEYPAFQRQLSVFEGFQNFFQNPALYRGLDESIREGIKANQPQQ
jgi:RHS repeat-associated protein